MPLLSARQSTGDLVEFVMALDPSDVPGDVQRMANACVLDWFGCVIAGAGEVGPTTVRGVLEGSAGAGRSSIVGGGRRVDAGSAALHNGYASHTLELDDFHLPSAVHASAPVLAAAFAVGEEVGASPVDVTRAFLVGYETMTRIGRPVGVDMMSAHHVHPTGCLGYFGAAAAAGSLLGLSHAEMVSALGVAGGQAGGLTEVVGTMSKGYFAGHSASGGIMSARLAAAGFASALDIVGGSAGVFAAFCAAEESELVGSRPFELRENSFKRFASCGLTHPMIEAILVLRQQVPQLRRRTPGRIEVRLCASSVDYINRPSPGTGLEAKFSGQFCAAVALLDGDVSARRFEDQRVSDAHTEAVMRSVQFICDDELDRDEAIVTIEADGQVWQHKVHGGSQPVDEPALRAKFLSLTTPRLGDVRAQWALEQLAQWPTGTDLQALLTLAREA